MTMRREDREDLNKPGVRIAVPRASSMDRFVSEHAAKADLQRFPDNAAAIAALRVGSRRCRVPVPSAALLAARQRLGKDRSWCRRRRVAGLQRGHPQERCGVRRPGRKKKRQRRSSAACCWRARKLDVIYDRSLESSAKPAAMAKFEHAAGARAGGSGDLPVPAQPGGDGDPVAGAADVDRRHLRRSCTRSASASTTSR